MLFGAFKATTKTSRCFLGNICESGRLFFSPCPLSVAITQGGAIQLANNGTDGVQGLQTLTMTNAAAAAQPGATILQYAQTSDGQQILVPSNQVVVQGERGGPISSSCSVIMTKNKGNSLLLKGKTKNISQ